MVYREHLMSQLTREKIKTAILDFCRREFEMENPGLDDDLREEHGFDSIDAIDLLLEIENLLDTELTHEEKKQAIQPKEPPRKEESSKKADVTHILE